MEQSCVTLTEVIIVLKRLQWSETDIEKLMKLDFCIKQIITEQAKRMRKR